MLYSRLHPNNWRTRLALRGVALAQLVYGVLLLPVWVAWYGAGTLPEWAHDVMRPAAKTLWFGRGGPLNKSGEVWCVW